MEDVAYPDVNDFYQYMSCQRHLSCIYDDPEASLDKFSGSLHPFGASIFAHHIEQVYGVDVIKSVWELLRRRDPSNYSLSLIDDGDASGWICSGDAAVCRVELFDGCAHASRVLC